MRVQERKGSETDLAFVELILLETNTISRFMRPLLCACSCPGCEDAMGHDSGTQGGHRALSGYRQVGGPHWEWLGPGVAPLVNNWRIEICLEGSPNSPVGLGSQALCLHQGHL